jgi:hypothetical protein
MLAPRPGERETWQRLDDLLNEVRRDRVGLEHRDLVAAHTGSLFAGIESAPSFEDWPIVADLSEVSARWVERVVGIEIDRLIIRILENQEGCVGCALIWVRHLIESRITLSQWAWAREAEGLLD